MSSVLKPGNKVCILLSTVEKKTLFKGGEYENKKVYLGATKAESIVGEIKEIKNGSCIIQTGKYDRALGFIPDEERTYPLDYLIELEKYRCIKKLFV